VFQVLLIKEADGTSLLPPLGMLSNIGIKWSQERESC